MLVTFFTAVRAEFGLAGLDQVHRCRPAMGLVVLCWLPSCPTGVDRRTGPPSRQVVPGARCWCAGVAGGVGGGLTGSRHTGGRAAEEVTFAGRLRPTTLTVATGQRLLICGPNGAGKSTLLRILAGDLTPDGGQVTRSGRIGYLPQEVSTATSERTLLAAFAHGRPGQTEEHSASLLSLGLFSPESLTVPIGRLSTGQRQRLAVAQLFSEPVDLLLLDEPTNHLSLGLVEELEAALEEYPGAVVVVSHDRRLRRRWSGEAREVA